MIHLIIDFICIKILFCYSSQWLALCLLYKQFSWMNDYGKCNFTHYIRGLRVYKCSRCRKCVYLQMCVCMGLIHLEKHFLLCLTPNYSPLLLLPLPKFSALILTHLLVISLVLLIADLVCILPFYPVSLLLYITFPSPIPLLISFGSFLFAYFIILCTTVCQKNNTKNKWNEI